MNLYRISQTVNNGYDTYSDAIVSAESEEIAKMIHPSEYSHDWNGKEKIFGSWCDVENVKVELIGTAKDKMFRGVVCSSFHAG